MHRALARGFQCRYSFDVSASLIGGKSASVTTENIINKKGHLSQAAFIF